MGATCTRGWQGWCGKVAGEGSALWRREVCAWAVGLGLLAPCRWGWCRGDQLGGGRCVLLICCQVSKPLFGSSKQGPAKLAGARDWCCLTPVFQGCVYICVCAFVCMFVRACVCVHASVIYRRASGWARTKLLPVLCLLCVRACNCCCFHPCSRSWTHSHFVALAAAITAHYALRLPCAGFRMMRNRPLSAPKPKLHCAGTRMMRTTWSWTPTWATTLRTGAST